MNICLNPFQIKGEAECQPSPPLAVKETDLLKAEINTSEIHTWQPTGDNNTHIYNCSVQEV